MLLASCQGKFPTNSDGLAAEAKVTTVQLGPSNVTLGTGGVQQFQAVARDQFGNPMAASFEWSAFGGPISADGLYTAGDVPGTFEVTATENSSGVSGSASVVIEGQTSGGLILEATFDQFQGSQDFCDRATGQPWSIETGGCNAPNGRQFEIVDPGFQDPAQWGWLAANPNYTVENLPANNDPAPIGSRNRSGSSSRTTAIPRFQRTLVTALRHNWV